MAKVMISLLGTGRLAKGDTEKNEYETTDYRFDDGSVYEEETFSSSALIKHFGIERVYFVGTAQSMWDNVAQKYGMTDDEVLALLERKEHGILDEKDLVKLGEAIDKKLVSKGSRCFVVREGENEEQLWAIFSKFMEILEELDAEDEVYIDITHLFRSVSIMTFVMAEMGKVLHGLKQCRLFYAMYKKNEPSQIVELTLFFELLDWSRAVRNLRDYGNGFDLLALVAESGAGKEVENPIADFTYALSLSSMASLQRSVKVIKGKLETFEKSHHKIIPLVAKELRHFVERLSIEDTARFQFELAHWYAENKNYAMAYITLVEAAITAECQNLGLNDALEQDRNQAKKSLYDRIDWNKNTKEDQKIGKAFKKTNDIRKNIAHKLPSEATKTNITPKHGVENFEIYWKDLAKLL